MWSAHNLPGNPDCDVPSIEHLMPQAREQLIAEDAAEGFPFEEPSVRAVERRAVKLANQEAL